MDTRLEEGVKHLVGEIYEGPVMVVAGEDVLLNADALLTEVGGAWGGFLVMRSVAGAELVQQAPVNRRFITVDGETPGAFIPRRVHPDSPVVRVTGQGHVPFRKKGRT